ncbi:hypothetical protein ILUMI_13179 [Ignelater luminosus]|uniref:Uncharacterized protein n=1 Tax=Ignelater luminosus TaxID=2038154 RepID=A0A8K0CSS1_IGNLU|nr:hypothetical protein ILUMI_13179 [Ignelater luminosus]
MPRKYEKACRYCGVNMELKQINDIKAVYVCSIKACKFYDFPEPVTKWVVVNRPIEEFEKEVIEKFEKELVAMKKRIRPAKHAKTAAIDEYVKEVYCNKFEDNDGFFSSQYKINDNCENQMKLTNNVDPDVRDANSVGAVNNSAFTNAISQKVSNLDQYNYNTHLDLPKIFNSLEPDDPPKKSKFDGFKFTSIVIKPATKII